MRTNDLVLFIFKFIEKLANTEILSSINLLSLYKIESYEKNCFIC